MRIRLWLALSLSLVILMSGSCAVSKKAPSFNEQVNSIVQPYSFNFATWETNTLFSQLRQKVINRQPESAFNSQSVKRYFSYIEQSGIMHLTKV